MQTPLPAPSGVLAIPLPVQARTLGISIPTLVRKRKGSGVD